MNEQQPTFVYEDIRSSSKKSGTVKRSIQNYGNGVFRHLDKVVKTIAFLVSLAVLLIFAAGALILWKLDHTFTLIALCVLVAGALLALITLFLIYAIGHIISQNNEILKHL